MPEIASLFEAGQAAFVANVGTLIERVANRTEVYAITPEGSVGMTGYRPRWEPNQAVVNALSKAVDSQLALQQSNLLAQAFNVGKRRALEANDVFSNATAKPLPAGVGFPSTYLGYRLEMITRAIQGRSIIGAQRQTFFVFWDGWDHHGEVLETQGRYCRRSAPPWERFSKP